MPYVKKVVQNFQKEYGAKEGTRRFFAWKGANPSQYKKGVATARQKGETIIPSLAKTKKGKLKAKKYG